MSWLWQRGVITYNVEINACVKPDQWLSGVNTQNVAISACLKFVQWHPGVITYKVAISACVKPVQWQLALSPKMLQSVDWKSLFLWESVVPS